MRYKTILGLFACFAPSALSQTIEPTDTVFSRDLEEFVVTGLSARSRIENPRIGAEHLELSNLALTPSFAGENDILKSITLLPGIRSEGDGGGGFEVRGGNAAQNLVLLDGISLYNPAHVMGIFSTFNDDAIGQATIFKGPIPAAYGGASSSALDLSLAPGDMVSYHGSATIGLLAAKLKVEGPIVKDKLSFAVTSRRSYVDAFLKMVPQYRSTVMNFYDITARFRYVPSKSHIFDASFFMSHDNMAIHNLMGMYWGNIGASMNWLVHLSDKWTSTANISLTHYDPKMVMTIMEMNQSLKTYIHNYALDYQLSFSPSENQTLNLGLRSELLRVKSGEWKLNAAGEKEIRSLWDNALWLEYNASFSTLFDLAAGMRLNFASVMTGPDFRYFYTLADEDPDFKSHNYINPEPRISLKFNINDCHNLKTGFGISTQNLHSIRSGHTTFPFDRFALTSYAVRPEISYQYSAGYSGMTRSGDFDWSAEIYYRNISNVYDYKDGRQTFSDISLESIILGGKGKSYGAEFIFRKDNGRLTGWLSYTISRTLTKIPGINNDKWYNATNDRRHDFSVTAIYTFSPKWNVSATWLYMSGRPLTAPDVKYEIGGETCYYYSARNAYKTPATHRLDISASYTGKLAHRYTSIVSFGFYNTYCRYNPYVIYFEDDSTKPSGTRAVLHAMYGLIPSLSWTVKF